MALQAAITAQIKPVQTGDNAFGTDIFAPTIRYFEALTDGTTAGKADLLYVAERAVATAANDDIDLTGSLTDVFGNAFDAAEIVAILLINAPVSGAANTTDLTIGGALNPFEGFLGGTTPTIGPIKPGGFVMIGASDAAGLGAVAAGTGDELRIANSAGATANYQIAILARSA